jgi:hypothetical protein
MFEYPINQKNKKKDSQKYFNLRDSSFFTDDYAFFYPLNQTQNIELTY